MEKPFIKLVMWYCRYLLLGGAIGGGASLAKQYEDWKKGLPDTQWVKVRVLVFLMQVPQICNMFQDIMPEIKLDEFRASLIKAGDNVRGKAREIDIDPALEATLGKLAGFRAWFEKRLDDAIKAAEDEAATNGGSVKKVDGSEEGGNGNGSGECKPLDEFSGRPLAF